MKLRKTISWLMGTLQRSLFPKLEQCWDIALTEKEKQLVSILELVEIERFIPKSSDTQWLGRKLCERESIARSFVTKSVYGYATPRALIEALETTQACAGSVVLGNLQTFRLSRLSRGLLPSLLTVILVTKSTSLWLRDL